MKRRLIFALCLASAGMALGCDSGSGNTVADASETETPDEVAGADTPDVSGCPRGELPLTVTSHMLSGNILTLDVAFEGACGTHEYAIWWSGTVATSDPPLLPLEFHHYLIGDTCAGAGTDTLVIDLSSLDDVAGPPSHALRLQFIPAWPLSGEEFLPDLLYTVDPEATPAPEGAIPVVRDCGGITG